MKLQIGFLLIAFIVTFTNLNAQNTNQTDAETELLGLPGDNLDLYAVLDLFQQSKTIEAFEESLNNEKTGINNLDLNLDDNVDFIKVETKQEKDDFVFILQVDILEGEKQDVAVILVSKDDAEKVTLQIVGDESLYGKDYVIEPKTEKPAITANPAYSGSDTVVVVNQPATVVVVESVPIVHYVYSPVYVPYYPPYYYGYYPVYYRPYPVISITFYRSNNRHHHNNYYGGRNNRGGNTVIINNNNNYNNYNKTRNTSNTVNRNKNEGNYKSNRSSTNQQKNIKTNNARKTTVKKDKNTLNSESQKNVKKSNVKNNNRSVSSKTSKVKTPSRPAKKPAAKPKPRRK